MLGNRKSKDTHWLSLKARLTAKCFEERADAIKAIVYKVTVGLTVPVFAVTGWVTMTSSSMAVTASYRNDFRLCAGRLLRVGITAQDAASACAAALRPGDLSSCVTRIGQQTQIAAPEALATCRQARRPEELSQCVVGINRYSRETVNPDVLNYCGRSLLPVRFANCVVGLRAETDFATTQAMETCIDASDKVSGFLPSFIPATERPTEFQPTQPIQPTQPNQPTQESTPLPPEATPQPSEPSTVPPATAPDSANPGSN
jgi:hypothetical protein